MKADELSGFLLLRKEGGITSFQSLNWVKKALATGKVGHTGTLDKFASGLLLVLVGRAVKLTPWFSGCDKRYEGIIHFGEETDTLDPEGQVIARGEVPSREALEAVLPRFRGDISQTPPAYSAIHIGGERSSRLARSGAVVEMKERTVSIYALELLSYNPPLASIRVHCSKGTYIRSLARDVAWAAGSRGFLQSLTRTAVAGFRLSEAPELPPPSAEDSPGAAWKTALRASLRPINGRALEALGLPRVLVDNAAAGRMIRGVPLAVLVREGAIVLPQASPLPVESLGEEEGGRAFAAGVFRSWGRKAPWGEDFLGIIEQKSGRPWSYGYVYAGA